MTYKKYDYKNLVIIVKDNIVSVFNQGKASQAGAIFKTVSLDLAMKWIDDNTKSR